MNTRAHTNTHTNKRTHTHTHTHKVHGDPKHCNDRSTDLYNPNGLTEVNDWYLRWNTLFVWDFAGR